MKKCSDNYHDYIQAKYSEENETSITCGRSISNIQYRDKIFCKKCGDIKSLDGD